MARIHPAVGIDLGTTNSTVAFVDATGRPETIRNAEGGLSTPSAVFFDRSQPVVGSEAMEAGVEEPERLALFAKRDVGELAFRKSICGASFPPEVLQALVLQKLKDDAELKLGEIEKAVVTVPAFFNEPCRKATQDAGRLAGLDVLDIINEPTAAAICFGVQQGFLSPDGQSDQEERILVYDLGGGTFDVTVMEIKDRNYHTLATNGDVYLGGMDWDRRIVDFIAEAWIEEYKTDPREDAVAEQMLLRKANQAKHALTQRDSVPIAFSHAGQKIRPVLSREVFDRSTEDLLERTLMTVGLVLDEASMSWNDLTRLILVGGSTRMPMIREELSRLTSLELDRSLSPDEAVAHGAAIYAGIRLGQDCQSFSGVSVTNVNSHDLGVLAKDPKTGDPRRQVMIKRNTSLPASERFRFRTHQEGQRNVKVEVVEGGDDRGRNATTIGKCLVHPLPPGTPKGTFVDVQFDYSQDGRLKISASLPTLHRNAEMALDRAAGMSETLMATWQQRIAAGIDEDTIAEVLALEAESPAMEAEPPATESESPENGMQANTDATTVDSSGGATLAAKANGGDSIDPGDSKTEFPGVRLTEKVTKPAKEAAENEPLVGAFGRAQEMSKGEATDAMPIVDVAVDARASAVGKQAKGKLKKRKKIKRKATPSAAVDSKPVVAADAKKVIPAPAVPAPNQSNAAPSDDLPPGLADLAATANAKSDLPDFTGIQASASGDDDIGLIPNSGDAGTETATGGGELDAFFSAQQNRERGKGSHRPPPSIDVKAARPKKKLRKRGAVDSSAATEQPLSASDADVENDWKRRGKRISSRKKDQNE